MKFTNATWFHTLVIILISFIGFSIATLIVEKVFGIKEDKLVALLTSVFTSPIVYFYFIKRVKRK